MKERYSTEQLHQGDCLEVMKEIPDNSVDMVLTDPPYGTTACSWDSVIPLEPMWKQLKRITKPNGAIAMTASQPFTTILISSNMGMFKYCWVWKKAKPTGFSHSKNMPLKDFEEVVIFSSGSIGHSTILGDRRMEYNPQGTTKCNRRIKRNKRGFDGAMERDGQVNEYTGTLTGFPKMVIEFNNVIANKTTHPTQKPVPLMEYLIKTYTKVGETVLDFTMGSGTTGVACVNLNRNFIGIELDEKYFKIAQKRIKNSKRGFFAKD